MAVTRGLGQEFQGKVFRMNEGMEMVVALMSFL